MLKSIKDMRHSDMESLDNTLLDIISELGDLEDAYGEYFQRSLATHDNALFEVYEKLHDIRQQIVREIDRNTHVRSTDETNL